MKFGGPVLTGGSSCASGLVIRRCGVGALIFGVGESPEVFAGGLPPRMLKSIGPFAGFAAPVPPLLGAPPFALAAPLGAPPGTPGFLPSGERETRAARFPCGGATGAGGAGVAESAIKVAEFPFAPTTCVAPTSGAGPAPPFRFFCAMRGAAPAFNSSFGRAGPLAVAIIAKSPGVCSKTGTSGAGASCTVATRRCFGCSLASSSLLMSSRGRRGPGSS